MAATAGFDPQEYYPRLYKPLGLCYNYPMKIDRWKGFDSRWKLTGYGPASKLIEGYWSPALSAARRWKSSSWIEHFKDQPWETWRSKSRRSQATSLKLSVLRDRLRAPSL